MKIRKLTPVRQAPSPEGFRTLARFALEPTDGVLIFDCSAVEAPNGRIFIYGPPSKHGGPLLNLAPDVRGSIIRMVKMEMGIDGSNSKAAA